MPRIIPGGFAADLKPVGLRCSDWKSIYSRTVPDEKLILFRVISVTKEEF